MRRPSPTRARNSLFRRLGRDRRGVSALEFALIAPILIFAYFGLAELSSALMAQRRVSHAASAVGDLVAQTDALHAGDLTDIWSVGGDIMAPFPTSSLQLRVTSITMNSTNQDLVDWSRDNGAGLTAYTAGSVMTVDPNLLQTPGDSVILAEAVYKFTSPVGKVIPNGITFNEKFYLRPRKSAQVQCISC